MASSNREPRSPIHSHPEIGFRLRFKRSSLLSRKVVATLWKLAFGLCGLCFAYLCSLEPGTRPAHAYCARTEADFHWWQKPAELSADEQRIARHFVTDTLPGLLQLGLIRKYERRAAGTLLLVEGKIWKERSRFFQESLLTEVLIYNKVNRFEPTTQVADYSSLRLYARASSADRKEFFD